MNDEIARFVRQRDEALLSLDESRIRALFRQWNGTEMPTDPHVFWGSVHKAITAATSLPIAFRRQSKAWLDEHGYRSFDDGDL